MVHEPIRQAHLELMAVHEEIRSEFAQLRRATLRRYLGDFNSPDLRSQLLEYGDGYTLRSVPVRLDDMLDAEQIVLIAMKYPLLAEDSVFDPHAHIVDIPYWRDYMGLRPEMRLEDGQSRTFHFMVWQQDNPMHGESQSRATFNRQLVLSRHGRLEKLIPCQERLSERFLTACMDWVKTRGRRLVVLVDARQRSFPPYMESLLADDAVLRIRTKLTKVNRKIMGRIISET